MLYATLIGRIGKDGDLRFLSSGTPVLSVSVATDTGFGDRKKTVWVKCNIWGKHAESLAPYIKKGGEVGFIGELSESEWTDDQGVSKKYLEMNVKEVQLVGGNKNGQPSNNQPVQNNQRQQPQQNYQQPQQQPVQQPVQSQPVQQNVQPINGGFDENSDVPF